MKQPLIIGLLCLFAFTACNLNDESLLPGTSQQEDAQRLGEIFAEIEAMAQSETCDNANKWTYMAYGHRACGGPNGYIAYSRKINTSKFRKLVKDYTAAENEYNMRWGIISICVVEPEPTDVVCEDGLPVLVY